MRDVGGAVILSDRSSDFGAFPYQAKVRGETFTVDVINCKQDLSELFAFRHRVFNVVTRFYAEHQGHGASHSDEDEYDQFCDHLVIKHGQQVVACYRLLRADVARQNIGFYSENEFKLENIYRLGNRFLEVGRAAVDSKYRDGSLIRLLWRSLGKYSNTYQISYIGGCCSVGDINAQQLSAIYAYARDKQLIAAPEECVQPNELNVVKGFRVDAALLDKQLVRSLLPPLLKGYFALGARLYGAPAYDPEFQVSDFFTVLRFDPSSRTIQRFCNL